VGGLGGISNKQLTVGAILVRYIQVDIFKGIQNISRVNNMLYNSCFFFAKRPIFRLYIFVDKMSTAFYQSKFHKAIEKEKNSFLHFDLDNEKAL
jgi:hypothetical protein